MASISKISEWFDRGVAQGATYMIVACDTFDYEDYPVFCKHDNETLDKYQELSGKNMQKVMEVYDLLANKKEQMNTPRVFRLPERLVGMSDMVKNELGELAQRAAAGDAQDDPQSAPDRP